MGMRIKLSLFRRSIRWSLGVIFLAFFLFQVYVFIPVIHSPVDGYETRKGLVKSANVTRSWMEGDSDYHEIDLISTSGLKVEITVRIPSGNTTALPVAILLGGVGTGRDGCRIIPRIKNAICVSLSYPYYGKKHLDTLGFLKNIRAIQQTVMDTPPAMMLTLDYVLSQPYSDTQQVELLGVSFGSYFVSIPAVYNQKVTRIWMAHGAAEPHKSMGHNYARDSKFKFLSNIIAYWAGYAIGAQYVDPEKWVGRVSPRPVIMINAENDKTFPHSSVAALHNAAKQPKEIIWTKGVHIAPSRTEVVEQLTNIVLSRIEGDYLKRLSNHR